MLDFVTDKKSSPPPLCGRSAERTALSGPHSDLSPLWGQSVSSKEGGKGFFKLNHWRSEVALGVSLASCARSDLQTPSRAGDTLSTGLPKGSHGMGGRQDVLGATVGMLPGKWAPWEGGTTGRKELHPPDPQNAVN